jgi:hypothetical protein
MLVALGKPPDRALQLAMKIPQDLVTASMLHGGRMSIMYRAERYATKYPHLVRDRGDGLCELVGFKPEVIWPYYLPTVGAGVVWGEGGPDEALEEMARNAEKNL